MSTPTPARTGPVPSARLVAVELRKMVDTRSGFWLLVSIGVLALAATAAVIAFAPDEDTTSWMFTRAIGLPLSVVLPIIATLSVTSEWSQRSGLGTFTLVPHRGRVVAAKAAATLVVGVASTGVALGVGALGTVAGSSLAGVDPVWDLPLRAVPQLLLGNLVGMAVGFTLGVVLRSSAAAVVGYVVVAFVLPGVLELLTGVRQWFADLQPWVDWNTTQVVLFEGATDTGEEWAMLGSTTLLWIVVPVAFGLVALRRAEVA